MKRLYPSDLTDFEWEVVKDLIPPAKKGGGKRRADIRQIFNACFYLTKTGCQWRMLPHEYPPWGTIYWYFAMWKKDGAFEKIHDKLVKIVRAQQGKKNHILPPQYSIVNHQKPPSVQKKKVPKDMMLVKR